MSTSEAHVANTPCITCTPVHALQQSADVNIQQPQECLQLVHADSVPNNAVLQRRKHGD